MENSTSRNEKTGSGSGDDDRVSAIYIAALYGSIFVTLVGLYIAATRLGPLSPMGALSVVGLCGVLVVGTMLPITLRSLRDQKEDGAKPQEEAQRPRDRLIRLAGATCFALIAVGAMMAGYVVPAAIVAFLSVALIYNVAFRAKE